MTKPLALHDRILGGILGGGIGDAWGVPYEGALPRDNPRFPATARLSDDTQLTIDKLTTRFALPTDPQMQDWAIVAASPDLIDKLLGAYEDPAFDDDDRFALMALLVASLDDAKSEGRDIDAQWERTARLLSGAARLHAYTMAYWSCGEDPDSEHHFRITPEVRSLWAKLRPACLALG